MTPRDMAGSAVPASAAAATTSAASSAPMSAPPASTAPAAATRTSAASSTPTTVVFDLGGVLVDWDPRHLYRRLIPDPAAMERFLAEVCTPEWNLRQDAGRSWREAIDLLVAAHPDHAALIEAYDVRWEEMLGGVFEETVALLEELDASGIELYALTNWSTDKFRVARPRFSFFDRFRAIVVSGDEGVIKPDPAIFRILVERYAIDPRAAVFVDDSAANVEAAAGLGFHAILFRGAAALCTELRAAGLPVAAAGG
jgi:2-haloacid dehalogenase